MNWTTRLHLTWLDGLEEDRSSWSLSFKSVPSESAPSLYPDTVVLLVPPAKLSITDLVHQHSLTVPLVARLGNSWPDLLLVRADLASHLQAVSQLSEGGLVITHFDSKLVSSLRERDLEVFCVLALVCHELGRQGVDGGGAVHGSARGQAEKGETLPSSLHTETGQTLTRLYVVFNV